MVPLGIGALALIVTIGLFAFGALTRRHDRGGTHSTGARPRTSGDDRWLEIDANASSFFARFFGFAITHVIVPVILATVRFHRDVDGPERIFSFDSARASPRPNDILFWDRKAEADDTEIG